MGVEIVKEKIDWVLSRFNKKWILVFFVCFGKFCLSGYGVYIFSSASRNRYSKDASESDG